MRIRTVGGLAALLLVAAAAHVGADLPTALPGYKVELVRTAAPDEGSWISMTVDTTGRLIISGQGGADERPLRVTLSSDGQVLKTERINGVHWAMGLLYAFNSLYVDGVGPQGWGIYRLLHDDQTDGFYPAQLISVVSGYPFHEHGAHGIALGPDNQIYVVCGNFVFMPGNISPYSPFRNYGVDQLLPPDDDPGGFGVGIFPPEGFVMRMGADGENPQLFCGGLRNVYQIAFDADGELFGYDNDQEVDWGMPWYRPTSVFHLVSGADYGYREGSAKWPDYYPDALPATAQTGLGSPAGLIFGTKSHFPPKYQKALFAADWAYGRILAVHLTPKVAEYEASYESFVEGQPLNVTAMEFGADGALYFITGGRKIQSELYRVSYVGPSESSSSGKDSNNFPLFLAGRARELRRQLERYQGVQDPAALDVAWPLLNSMERTLRYTARTAVESQPVAQWQARALAETRQQASLTALLALARCGGKELQDPVLRRLADWPLDKLSDAEQLEKLRIIEVSFIRQGAPDGDMAKQVTDELDRYYPSKSEAMNAELCQLLVYLKAPDVVTKTLALLDAALTQEEQIRYIYLLRHLQTGWTMDQRKYYFTWFNKVHAGEAGQTGAFQGELTFYPWSGRQGDQPLPSPQLRQWFAEVGRDYADGGSFPGYLANFRKEAVSSLSAEESAELTPWLAAQQPVKPRLTLTFQKRALVKNWTMADLAPLLTKKTPEPAAVHRGREIFVTAGCIQCHSFDGGGGTVGPDLTAVARRYSRRDILESIIEPSKVVAEQYRNTEITTTNEEELSGRVVGETTNDVMLMTDLLNHDIVAVPKASIQSRRVSKLSPMPEGLVDHFNPNEILDLLTYLESGGRHASGQ